MGLLWGSAGLLLFPPASVPHQVFIAFLLGGMATGSVATYSAVRGLSQLFVLPALLPVSIRFLLIGEAVSTAMGIMTLVYAGILLAVAEGMYRTITTSIQLRIVNLELVDYLEDAKNSAEALNAELIGEIARHTRTEQELRSSEARYRSIVDSSLSGILIVDDSYSIVYANGEAAAIFGQSVEELVGLDFRTALDPDSRALLSDRYVRRQRGEVVPTRYAVTVRLPDGAPVHLEINTALIREQDGRPRTVVQLMDVSERRKAEETMQMASRLEAIHTLAGGVAHDLNNLMAVVLGNAQLLRLQHQEVDERLERSLDQIAEAARKAGDLSQQLLGYARGGKYDPRPIALNEVVTEILELQESTLPDGVRLRPELADDLWPVEADRSQMSQLIMNLCLNAAEAVGDEGEVTVRSYNATGEAAEGELSREVETPIAARPTTGDWVVLEIADDGQGMDRETIERVFEPYFSTKPGGRGLGLAAVWGIVDNHGGHLTVESAPGRGAVFRAWVPRGDSVPERDAGDGDQAPTGDETVMVVDDDEPVREVLRRYLEELGYRTLIASNGAEALDIARTHEGEIHLTVLDMRMPVLDGANTFPILTHIRPETRVLICSGYELDSRAQELLDAGARAFVKKPVSMNDFARTVRNALDN
jgi:PAS domain S-box-containing protein